MSECPSNCLVQRSHAQVFIVVSPFELRGASLIVENHLLLQSSRLCRWVWQAAYDDSPRKVVAEVDSFGELTAYHAKEYGKGSVLLDSLRVVSEC